MSSCLKKLTVREIKFLTLYAETDNATQAAKDAGYPEAGAAVQASRLLKEKRVVDALNEIKDQYIEVLIATKERVIRELSRMAFADPAQLFTDTGVLRHIDDIPRDLRSAIAAIKIEDRSGADDFVTVIEVKLIDRTKSLDMLCKRLGVYELDNKQKAATIRVGYGKDED